MIKSTAKVKGLNLVLLGFSLLVLASSAYYLSTNQPAIIESDAAGIKNSIQKPFPTKKPTLRPIPTKKPTPRPTPTIVGSACCTERDCNPTCANPNCIIYKCRNAVLCTSGGSGQGTCVRK